MLISKEFTFDAAHRLMKYKGKCENLHGHTYKLRV
ncbi:MAG: 6-carboxytetrahydropterin synthase, partial [Thermotogaceae bacterium]|nr:6-carboxytetrahydropterin synthase [Thermotogaceae bacterium]